MLFLVTGASGVGKTTARRFISPKLGTGFDAVELSDLGIGDDVTVARRQQMAEVAALRARSLRLDGRHLVLSGDPVAAGEMIAAPSAASCGGIAVCLLDASAEAQTARLGRRSEPAELVSMHLGFAQWMREHAVDPVSRLEVLTAHAAPGGRWERLAAAAEVPGRWRVHVIDTSDVSPAEVGSRVLAWISAALRDDSLVMHPEHWPDQK